MFWSNKEVMIHAFYLSALLFIYLIKTIRTSYTLKQTWSVFIWLDFLFNINFFNWDSFHARLKSHCEARNYKKKKHKKIKAYRKSV